MKRIYIISLMLFFAGCSSIGIISSDIDFEAMFGPAEVQERVQASLPEDHIDYWLDVKPVVEKRCVVCHGCFDAPCQLKMTAFEGIDRGASKQKVYDASRLSHAPLTRLFEDASTTQQWRKKEFFPVLNEHGDSLAANQKAGLMYQLLSLKEQNPQPKTAILPDDFTFGYDRAEVCATPEEMTQYTEQNPLWGMPYALPGLMSAEQNTLKIWLEQGAKSTPRAPLSEAYQKQISAWEAYLNGDSNKQQLVNRYIFEHLYLANIYFPELGSQAVNSQNSAQQVSKQAPTPFFKLIRSSTPPGDPVNIIASRRPYDDPMVSRVYYRLVPYLETIVTKTHLPFAFDSKRMSRWNDLFYSPNYEVAELPGYTESIAANPFKSFEQLPMESRYHFLLDEAQYIIMNFIKGPVCRGQVAVNVIKDHFWVFFISPDLAINHSLEHEIDINADELELPSAQEDIFLPLTNWIKYSNKAKEAAARKEAFLIENYVGQGEQGLKIDLNLIWDGTLSDAANPYYDLNKNAALTVFRHYDNASVHKGLLGNEPQTAWVIDYPLLERIYYLLVSGYDVYGNVGHQLFSRLYMDFLRMEGENAFLDFLPQNARQRELEDWYQDAQDEVKDFLSSPSYYQAVGTSVNYTTNDPKTEFYHKLIKHLAKANARTHSLANVDDTKIRNEMLKLDTFTGIGVSQLSELSYIQIRHESGSTSYLSLMKNLAHKNITSMFAEDTQLIPERHNVTVLNGIIGSYPNTLIQVNEADVGDLVDTILTMKTAQDYEAMLDKYGMRRSNPNFWQYSDDLHQFIREYNSVNSGFVDYNRLENR